MTKVFKAKVDVMLFKDGRKGHLVEVWFKNPNTVILFPVTEGASSEEIFKKWRSIIDKTETMFEDRKFCKELKEKRRLFVEYNKIKAKKVKADAKKILKQ
jgi:hypothetical protein